MSNIPRHLGAKFGKNESLTSTPVNRAASSDWKVQQVLRNLTTQEAYKAFADHGVSDFWLPISRQLLRRLLADQDTQKEFLFYQDRVLDHSVGLVDDKLAWPSISNHGTVEDDEELVRMNRVLGEGGYGIVEEVSVNARFDRIICVRKRIGTSRILRVQKQIMEAFAREINVMRQVDHPHCVKFLGSYTDPEHVNIISQPVADGDLATYLGRDLQAEGKAKLYRWVGCICNAINYLHSNNIRHEDLKPQNILVLGDRILLTDFGFSLDFSDDSISTTTGRPSAWTIRYSAPEVLNFEPRNRASDIFSLGCILVEILAALAGIPFAEVKAYWTRYGDKHSSFAFNQEAWNSLLVDAYPRIHTNAKFLVDYVAFLLDTNRSHRPNAQQIVDRLKDLSIFNQEGDLPGVGSTDRVDLDEPCRMGSRCRGLQLNAEDDAHSVWMTEKINPHRTSILSRFEFFYPWCDDNWVYGLWDIDFNFLHADSGVKKSNSNGEEGFANHAYETYHEEFVRRNMITIIGICDRMYKDAFRSGTTSVFWKAGKPKAKGVPSDEEKKHSLLSTKLLSLKHAFFLRTAPFISGPTSDPLESSGRGCMPNGIQITLLPICLPKSPYYGNFFWMISYQKGDCGVSGSPYSVREGDLTVRTEE